ncbi:MAG: DMT family transporter [Acidimicrobiia bacterium]|nr:DMT family transporter [Acidimicrobiia bacterium]
MADAIPRTRSAGVWLALVAACVSGVSVFVNAYAVKAVPDPTAYTTLKNLVAAVIVGSLLAVATARGSSAGFARPRTRAELAGLGVVAVIGGSVPFVLFFEGLARASAKDAAFVQKTLVIWVAVLAVAFLHERLGLLQVGAVVVLVVGPALLGTDLSALRPGLGEAMILAATLLWSVEVVVAKRLLAELSALTVGTARLAGGAVLLVAYVAVRGNLGALVPDTAAAWGWVLLTGTTLGVYVTVWFAALARAQAVDVTAVLVFGAVITAVLDALAKGVPVGPQLAGLALIVAGTVAFVAVATRTRDAALDHSATATR